MYNTISPNFLLERFNEPVQQNKQELSLSDYLSIVQNVVHKSFVGPSWVKAEIRQLAVKNGHHYLELSEKGETTNNVVATCKATIWASRARILVSKFQKESGIELSSGLSVLIRVQAKFSPLYGFTINIEDIDPSFTLGDLARRYQQIMAKLSAEGLVDKNKQLPQPFDINNVIVIAPERAAGLEDFKKDADILHNAGICNFVYHAATFQGNTAPASIASALRISLTQWASRFPSSKPDLIVVIRGGGTVNDLAYLNDYDLAVLLCKRTVPIWVGIGHKRDKTILDEVAHRSFDTPSKVIFGISSHIANRIQQTVDYFNNIKNHTQRHIQDYQNKNEQLIQSIQTSAKNQAKTAQLYTKQLHDKTQFFALQHLQNYQNKNEQFIQSIQASAYNQVRTAQVQTKQSQESIRDFSLRHISTYQSTSQQNMQLIKTFAQRQSNDVTREVKQLKESILSTAQQQTLEASKIVENLLREILLQNPQNILAKGYAVARSHGKIINSIKQIQDNQLEIQLQDGTISTQITQVTQND